ncbi:MAG: hypothetical protein ACRDGM_18070 [bacterium]
MAGYRDSQFDLTLNDTVAGVTISLMLSPTQPKQVSESSWPETANPIARVWRSTAGGMGVSRNSDSAEEVIQGYAYGKKAYTRAPDVVGPSGKETTITLNIPSGHVIRSSFELSGDLYILAGRYCYKMTEGGTTAVISKDFGATYTAFSALNHITGPVYVGGQGGPIWSFTGTVWAQAAVTAARHLVDVFWVRNGVGEWVMVGSFGSNFGGIRYVTQSASIDPMVDVNWTPSTEQLVGPYYHNINNLVASDQKFYATKQDGVYTIDGRLYTPRLVDWRQNLGSASYPNGQAAMFHGNHIYAGHLQGLTRVDTRVTTRIDAEEWVQPGQGRPNETPIYGWCSALCPEQDGWFYAAFYNGVDAWVCAGRDVGGQVEWHGSEADFPGTYVTHMRVSSLTGTPKLWISTWNGTVAALYRKDVFGTASAFQSWKQGGSAQFENNWSIYFPGETFGHPADLKAPFRHSIISENLGSGVQLNLYRSTDAGVESLVGSSLSSPSTTITSTSPPTTGYRFDFRMNGVGTNTSPAFLRAMKTLSVGSEPQNERRSYMVDLGDNVALRDGGQDKRNPQTVFQYLTAMEGRVITITDELGGIHTAYIHTVVPSKRIQSSTTQGVKQHWLRTARIEVSIILKPSTYEGGAVYDGVDVYA